MIMLDQNELHQVGYLNQLLLIGQMLEIKLVENYLRRFFYLIEFFLLETWFEKAKTPGNFLIDI